MVLNQNMLARAYYLPSSRNNLMMDISPDADNSCLQCPVLHTAMDKSAHRLYQNAMHGGKENQPKLVFGCSFLVLQCSDERLGLYANSSRSGQVGRQIGLTMKSA